MAFSNEMGFQGTRHLVINSHKVPNILAWMAIDTIPIPSQVNLLEVNEQNGYETEISNCEVKTSFIL